MAISIRKRRRLYNQPGHAHYATFSCVHRWPLLQADLVKLKLVRHFDIARRRHDMALLAYVIMPEHVHLLAWPRRREYSLGRLLYDIKRPVSVAARRMLEGRDPDRLLSRLLVKRGRSQTFRFWQPGGGFDRNLVKRSSLRCVAEYIHNNPVRRGLVERSTGWRWSSARFWEGVEGADLKMDWVDA